jgi:hypothetical protein
LGSQLEIGKLVQVNANQDDAEIDGQNSGDQSNVLSAHALLFVATLLRNNLDGSDIYKM